MSLLTIILLIVQQNVITRHLLLLTYMLVEEVVELAPELALALELSLIKIDNKLYILLENRISFPF